MGWETANIHLGSRTAHALLLDLAARPADWLHEAARRMLDVVNADWEVWKEGAGPQEPRKARKAARPAKAAKTKAAKAPARRARAGTKAAPKAAPSPKQGGGRKTRG
jgi:hypothetical protein